MIPTDTEVDRLIHDWRRDLSVAALSRSGDGVPPWIHVLAALAQSTNENWRTRLFEDLRGRTIRSSVYQAAAWEALDSAEAIAKNAVPVARTAKAAALHSVLRSASLEPFPADVASPTGTRKVRVGLMLVEEANQLGRFAQLELHPYHLPNAALTLVQHPYNQTQHFTREVLDSFELVSALVRREFRDSAALRDIAVMWSVAYDSDLELPFIGMGGKSAGAAFYVALAVALRGVAGADPRWRGTLDRIDAKKLPHVAITAAVTASGELDHIRGLSEKLEGWIGGTRTPGVERVAYVARKQPLSRFNEHFQPCANVVELLTRLADTHNPRSASQSAVIDTLRHNETPTIEALKRCAAEPATDLITHAAKRYAYWSLGANAHLTTHFVPLSLLRPLRKEIDGDAAKPRDAPPQGYKSLLELMATHDSECHGYLLTGDPGGGKSTLLQATERTRAADLIRWLSSDEPQGPCPEVCIYLRLKDFAAEPLSGKQATQGLARIDQVITHRALEETLPECVRSLFTPVDQRGADQRRPKVRFLFDGLNELGGDDVMQWEDRAKRLASLAHAMGGERVLPSLFATRSLNIVSLEEVGRTVLTTHVDRWRVSDIEHYLDRRFGPNNYLEERAALARICEADATAADFYGLPFNLDVQCELFECGVGLKTSRAEMLGLVYWSRLRREWNKQAKRAPLLNNAVRFADRRLLQPESQMWMTRGLKLPQGQLTESLQALAGALWFRDAREEMHGGERSQASLSSDDLVRELKGAGLDDGLHQAEHPAAIALAVQLGLIARSDDGKRYSFQEQMWFEFFATKHRAAAERNSGHNLRDEQRFGPAQPLPPGLEGDEGSAYDASRFHPFEPLNKMVKTAFTKMKSGYVFLRGGPARGKTSWALQWKRESEESSSSRESYSGASGLPPLSGWFFARRTGDSADGYANEVVALQSLISRARKHCGIEPISTSEELGSPVRLFAATPNSYRYRDVDHQRELASNFQRALNELAIRKNEQGQKIQPLVLLLDGADELWGPQPGTQIRQLFPRLFPAELPEGVYLVILSRPGPHLGEQHVEQKIDIEFGAIEFKRCILSYLDAVADDEDFTHEEQSILRSESFKMNIVAAAQGAFGYVTRLTQELRHTPGLDRSTPDQNLKSTASTRSPRLSLLEEWARNARSLPRGVYEQRARELYELCSQLDQMREGEGEGEELIRLLATRSCVKSPVSAHALAKLAASDTREQKRAERLLRLASQFFIQSGSMSTRSALFFDHQVTHDIALAAWHVLCNPNCLPEQATVGLRATAVAYEAMLQSQDVEGVELLRTPLRDAGYLDLEPSLRAHAQALIHRQVSRRTQEYLQAHVDSCTPIHLPRGDASLHDDYRYAVQWGPWHSIRSEASRGPGSKHDGGCDASLRLILHAGYLQTVLRTFDVASEDSLRTTFAAIDELPIDRPLRDLYIQIERVLVQWHAELVHGEVLVGALLWNLIGANSYALEHREQWRNSIDAPCLITLAPGATPDISTYLNGASNFVRSDDACWIAAFGRGHVTVWDARRGGHRAVAIARIDKDARVHGCFYAAGSVVLFLEDRDGAYVYTINVSTGDFRWQHLPSFFRSSAFGSELAISKPLRVENQTVVLVVASSGDIPPHRVRALQITFPERGWNDFTPMFDCEQTIIDSVPSRVLSLSVKTYSKRNANVFLVSASAQAEQNATNIVMVAVPFLARRDVQSTGPLFNRTELVHNSQDFKFEIELLSDRSDRLWVAVCGHAPRGAVNLFVLPIDSFEVSFAKETLSSRTPEWVTYGLGNAYGIATTVASDASGDKLCIGVLCPSNEVGIIALTIDQALADQRAFYAESWENRFVWALKSLARYFTGSVDEQNIAVSAFSSENRWFVSLASTGHSGEIFVLTRPLDALRSDAMESSDRPLHTGNLVTAAWRYAPAKATGTRITGFVKPISRVDIAYRLDKHGAPMLELWASDADRLGNYEFQPLAQGSSGIIANQSGRETLRTVKRKGHTDAVTSVALTSFVDSKTKTRQLIVASGSDDKTVGIFVEPCISVQRMLDSQNAANAAGEMTRFSGHFGEITSVAVTAFREGETLRVLIASAASDFGTSREPDFNHGISIIDLVNGLIPEELLGQKLRGQMSLYALHEYHDVPAIKVHTFVGAGKKRYAVLASVGSRYPEVMLRSVAEILRDAGQPLDTQRAAVLTAGWSHTSHRTSAIDWRIYSSDEGSQPCFRIATAGVNHDVRIVDCVPSFDESAQTGDSGSSTTNENSAPKWSADILASWEGDSLGSINSLAFTYREVSENVDQIWCVHGVDGANSDYRISSFVGENYDDASDAEIVDGLFQLGSTNVEPVRWLQNCYLEASQDSDENGPKLIYGRAGVSFRGLVWESWRHSREGDRVRPAYTLRCPLPVSNVETKVMHIGSERSIWLAGFEGSDVAVFLVELVVPKRGN